MFLTFWLTNALRATAACHFSTSQLPQVVRRWCVLCIFTWRFFMFPLNTCLLASLLFDPPDTQVIGKTQRLATFLTFCAFVVSFFWLSHAPVFFSSDPSSSLHIVGSLTFKPPFDHYQQLGSAGLAFRVSYQISSSADRFGNVEVICILICQALAPTNLSIPMAHTSIECIVWCCFDSHKTLSLALAACASVQPVPTTLHPPQASAMLLMQMCICTQIICCFLHLFAFHLPHSAFHLPSWLQAT